MKIGLISDVHEHTKHLQRALERLERERVDQIVTVGDLFETGERIEDTCRLLADAKSVGVWGNHDFGLSFEPDEEMRTQYGDIVLGYMTSLKPTLEVQGCHFSHIEPWLDPTNLMDLWYLEGPPKTNEQLARIFDAVPHRWIFVGHYHRWLLATPDGLESWSGGGPIQLSGDRFFVVLGALCDGHFATLDTQTGELTPYRCR